MTRWKWHILALLVMLSLPGAHSSSWIPLEVAQNEFNRLLQPCEAQEFFQNSYKRGVFHCQLKEPSTSSDNDIQLSEDDFHEYWNGGNALQWSDRNANSVNRTDIPMTW